MDYKSYYINQIGSGKMPVYYGARYQKGMGLGSMFKSFFRWIVPIFKTHAVPVLKEGAKVIGNEASKTAANIANDAIEEKDIKTSIKQRAHDVIENLSDKSQATIQSGNGYKKRKRILKFHKQSKNKKRFDDIFEIK
jgi:hypothetical protein